MWCCHCALSFSKLSLFCKHVQVSYVIHAYLFTYCLQIWYWIMMNEWRLKSKDPNWYHWNHHLRSDIGQLKVSLSKNDILIGLANKYMLVCEQTICWTKLIKSRPITITFYNLFSKLSPCSMTTVDCQTKPNPACCKRLNLCVNVIFRPQGRTFSATIGYFPSEPPYKVTWWL